MGSLTYLKAIEADEDFLASGAFWARVQQCLYSAAQIQSTNRASIVPLLDELDKTGRTLAKRIATFLAPWSIFESEDRRLLVSLLETGQWVPCFISSTEQAVFGSTFLSLAVRYGIIEYIEAKANQGCLVQHFRTGVWPLLLDAVYVDSNGIIGPPNAAPRLDMISCLLKKGADPNYPISGIEGVKQSSIWVETLQHILDKYVGMELKSPWSEIAEMMIRHGARVDKDMINLFKDHKRMDDGRVRVPFSYGWKEVSLFDYLNSVKQRVSRSSSVTERPSVVSRVRVPFSYGWKEVSLFDRLNSVKQRVSRSSSVTERPSVVSRVRVPFSYGWKEVSLFDRLNSVKQRVSRSSSVTERPSVVSRVRVPFSYGRKEVSLFDHSNSVKQRVSRSSSVTERPSVVSDKLGRLTAEIECCSAAAIDVSYEVIESISDRIKGLIEDFTRASWDWWPLKPRMEIIPAGYARIRWSCVSVITFHVAHANRPSLVTRSVTRTCQSFLQSRWLGLPPVPLMLQLSSMPSKDLVKDRLLVMIRLVTLQHHLQHLTADNRANTRVV